MHIALLLHIYQPPTQYRKMVKKISKQSYEKIVKLLEEFPEAKITLNMNASLTEQLVKVGLDRLLERMVALAKRGQIEFVGSGAYHPILPDLPKREIIRQIKLNNNINQSILGSAYNPKGLFPPELAYDASLGEVVEELGFDWILVDGTAIADWRKFLSFIYRKKGGRLLVFPREGALSYKIAFGRIRTALGLLRAIGASQVAKRKYVVLAMDGETFGHHQPKQIRFLRELFAANKKDKRINLVSVSQLLDLYPARESVELLASTWGYTEEVEGKKIWVRWRNPTNPAHWLLDRLRHLAISVVGGGDSEARKLLDRGLSSDTFWWASGEANWHPGMVDRGARFLLEAVMKSENASLEQKRMAKGLRKGALCVGREMFAKRRRSK